MLALTCAMLGACDPAPQEARSPFSGSSAPIPCKSDEDCPPLACGPCEPGAVVQEQHTRIDCKVDPCVDGGAVCGAEGVCVVREGSRFRERKAQ